MQERTYPVGFGSVGDKDQNWGWESKRGWVDRVVFIRVFGSVLQESEIMLR